MAKILLMENEKIMQNESLQHASETIFSANTNPTVATEKNQEKY